MQPSNVDVIKSGAQLDVVYIDISKAYDCLFRGKLLKKLYHMGAQSSMLNWIESYVTNRK